MPVIGKIGLTKVYSKFRRIACAIAVGGITAISGRANARPLFLGPVNPGAESGSDHWYSGVSGTGSLSIDDTDPAAGHNDFTIGNTTVGKGNRADWRSEAFALGPAADGASPITFSFAYKLPGEITGGENLLVYLRFFDVTGTNFLKERIIFVGSRTGDSNMTSYKRMVIPGIHAPKQAQVADVRIMANHSAGAWTSGIGRFDDFSVTVASKPSWAGISAGVGTLAALAVVVIRKRRVKGAAGE